MSKEKYNSKLTKTYNLANQPNFSYRPDGANRHIFTANCGTLKRAPFPTHWGDSYTAGSNSIFNKPACNVIKNTPLASFLRLFAENRFRHPATERIVPFAPVAVGLAKYMDLPVGVPVRSKNYSIKT